MHRVKKLAILASRDRRKLKGSNSTLVLGTVLEHMKVIRFASSTEWLSDCRHKSWCERCGKGCQKLPVIWIRDSNRCPGEQWSKTLVFARLCKGIILPRYICVYIYIYRGLYIISHYKDTRIPINQPGFNGMFLVGFDHCSSNSSQDWVKARPASRELRESHPCRKRGIFFYWKVGKSQAAKKTHDFFKMNFCCVCLKKIRNI